MTNPLAQLDALETCGCHNCLALLGKVASFYVLCPQCGNKRCPKATNHVHECTRSNDPGQIGSRYGANCDKPCCEAQQAPQGIAYDVFSALREIHNEGYYQGVRA